MNAIYLISYLVFNNVRSPNTKRIKELLTDEDLIDIFSDTESYQRQSDENRVPLYQRRSKLVTPITEQQLQNFDMDDSERDMDIFSDSESYQRQSDNNRVPLYQRRSKLVSPITQQQLEHLDMDDSEREFPHYDGLNRDFVMAEYVKTQDVYKKESQNSGIIENQISTNHLSHQEYLQIPEHKRVVISVLNPGVEEEEKPQRIPITHEIYKKDENSKTINYSLSEKQEFMEKYYKMLDAYNQLSKYPNIHISLKEIMTCNESKFIKCTLGTLRRMRVLPKVQIEHCCYFYMGNNLEQCFKYSEILFSLSEEEKNEIMKNIPRLKIPIQNIQEY